MEPSYYRAEIYGDELTPYLTKFYILYSTPCYDFCCDSKRIAEKCVNLDKKEIKELCSKFFVHIKKIDKQYSRYAKTSIEAAVQHLIFRQNLRIQYLVRDLTRAKKFIAKVDKEGVDTIVQEYTTY